MGTYFWFNLTSEIWGSILCLTGLFCVMTLKIDDWTSRRFFPKLFVCDFFLLLTDIIAVSCDGRPGDVMRAGVYMGNTLAYIFSFVMLTWFTDFVCTILENRIGRETPLKRCVHIVCMGGIFATIVNLWNPFFFTVDASNRYCRGSWFWLSQTCGILTAVVMLYLLIRYRQRLVKIELIVLLMFDILPMCSMIFQIWYYGISLLNISTTLLLMVCFVVMVTEANRMIYNQQLELANQKSELADSRAAIMLSQIQPHFLYNSLNSIYYLCGKDPALAKKAVGDFADYLRFNLDSIKSKKKIPFARELEHIEAYLFLEKLRFEERLKVEYEIESKQFMIPTLCIQPLVENAVKHGICQRPEGGTVTIEARETDSCYEIRVLDNGIGFDPNNIPVTERDHVGIENVRRRLELECNGTLEIFSMPDVGTTSIVKIPKG